MKGYEDYLEVAQESDLIEDRMLQVRVGSRVVAIIKDGGEIYALDNRCPHMGFPLSQGTFKDGILTCHWHHARFDVRSGCTFDLFADDVPIHETRIVDGAILVSREPARSPTVRYYRNRLLRGLEQNIGLIQAKSIIGLLNGRKDCGAVVREIALYGGKNHENWGTGLTSLTVVANLWEYLSEKTRIHALAKAARMVAQNCAGMPARRDRNPLHGSSVSMVQLKRWFHNWVMVRQRDGGERTLLTAAELAPASSEFNDLVFGAISDRVYSNQGHTLDFANKSLELLDQIGWDAAPTLLPTIMPPIAGARGAEEQSSWRNPVDLIGILEETERELPKRLQNGGSNRHSVRLDLLDILWSDDPEGIAASLMDEISKGADIRELAKHVCYTAALRLARFPESNDINDWFDPVHTFSYANAVYQSIGRSVSPDTVRALFHAALSVYKDRFLNIPEAALPHERRRQQSLPDAPDELLEHLHDLLNHRQNLGIVTALVARYIDLDHPRELLIDSLAFATLREDLDFHKLQVLEAGVRQAALWRGRPEESHIYVGVARHLAAHCPTRRAESNMTDIAIRLHRGEDIYMDERA